MALWLIYRGRANVVVGYSNQHTGAYQRLGDCPNATLEALIVEWIVAKGVAAPGDQIRFGAGMSGRVLVVSRGHGEA